MSVGADVKNRGGNAAHCDAELLRFGGFFLVADGFDDDVRVFGVVVELLRKGHRRVAVVQPRVREDFSVVRHFLHHEFDVLGAVEVVVDVFVVAQVRENRLGDEEFRVHERVEHDEGFVHVADSVVDVVDFAERDEELEGNFGKNQNEENEGTNFYVKNAFFVENRAQSGT